MTIYANQVDNLQTMVSIADVPEVLFLNERQIENLFSYITEEQIREIVRGSHDVDENKKDAWQKLLQLRYFSATEAAEEDEIEDIADLISDQDSIGQFATLHTNLKESSDINEIKNMDEDMRDSLSEGDFVETKGTVRTSPINELQQVVDDVKPFFGLLDVPVDDNNGPDDLDLNDIQKFIQKLNTSEDLYILDIPSDTLNADLVFSLAELKMQGNIEFPSEYTEYTVLGRIEHTYSEGEERSLMDLMDVLPGNDRESRQQRRVFMNQIASSASELTGRQVSKSDFKVSYPDIQVKPMAVYLFS